MQVAIRPFDLITNSQNGGAGATVSLAVLTTSATVAVSPATVGTRTVRIFNSGTNIVFINFGPSTAIATLANSMPMLPNSVETFYFHNDWTLVAAIAGATGNTLYITAGEGS
jgi:hypothetical protein